MGLPLRLVMAVIQVESRGNPNAINVMADRSYSIFPTSQSEASRLLRGLERYTSEFGIGLMQIHYAYHGNRYGVTPTDLLDPRVNITIGCDILRATLRKPGNLVQRIGRYNAKTRHKQVTYAAKILNALGGR